MRSSTKLLSAAVLSVLGVGAAANAAVVAQDVGGILSETGANSGIASVTPAVTPGAGYSNITGFTGFGVSQGPTATTGNTRFTHMLLDDMTTGPGGSFNQIKFTIANNNAVTWNLGTAEFRMFDSDGTSGGPGTAISAGLLNFTFNATLNANTTYTITSNPLSTPITLLPGHTYWTGIMVNNVAGAASAVNTQNVGQGIFNPVDVGSSADLEWFSTAFGATTSDFVAANPAGAIVTSPFAGNPIANYGLEFANSPEPASIGLLCIGMGALAARRRKA